MSPLGRYVVETVVTLAAVIALGLLVLYGARRAGVAKPGGPLELVGKLPLEARRSVYLVRVGTSIYVLGASEAGLIKLGKILEHELKLERGVTSHVSFREALQRTLVKKSDAPAPPEPSAPAGGRDS